MRRPIVLVKLGGSLITDKGREGVARQRVIERLAREIAALARGARGPRLVIGHGSGSFGHAAAARAGLSGGARTARAGPRGISRTQRRARELHRLVAEALEDAGARPFSLSPSSFMTTAGGKAKTLFTDPVFAALDAGMVPLVHGDVVLDRKRGASIVSTEDVLVALGREAIDRSRAVARAVWLGETDGVRAPDGSTVARLTARQALGTARRVTGASGTDVTGGMALRLRAAGMLARWGVPSWIVDGRKSGALAAAVAGLHSGGTRVVTA